MMETNKTLVLFTDSFPYGLKETFLENEISYLADAFEKIHIFPLHGEGQIRPQPINVHIHAPFLSFHPKNQKRLLIAGLFNLSPLKFALKELITKSVYANLLHLRVWAAALFEFRAAYANRSLMKELQSLIDSETVVYSYWGDKLALLIPFLKRLYPFLKTVARFHRTDLYEEFKGGYIPFRAIVLPSIDHCVFISEDGMSYLTKRYPEWIRTASLYRLGVSDHGLNPVNDALPFHVVSCSYMVQVKRIPLLIEALNKLNIPVKWTHLGTGPMYNTILNQSKQLPDSVQTELLGEKSNQEVLAYYASTPIDLFINVSESEGVPVSIMEALSFGIPVIATNAGGTGEIVDEQVGALLSVDVTSFELAKALELFIQNKNVSFLRHNARKRWLERCDASSNYGAFALFLKTMKN